MRAKQEYRNRASVEVAVLDALVDRSEDGMTVFELRAAVDADIDAIEGALAGLKDDGLISVEEDDGRVRIHPDSRVVPDPSEGPSDERGFLDAVRERLGL
jgi:DNA-binding transcriptional ArsR family regulator